MTSVAQAKAELQGRLDSRESFEKWLAYRQAPFKPALHQKLLIAELERISSGDNRRLMVFMPPGSAKSTYVSVEFPAWYLGKHPVNSIIGASHTQELAERFGRRVRNLVAEDKFKSAFGVGLSADSAAAGRWDTDRGGEYFAAGVGGAITGRRADLCLTGKSKVLTTKGFVPIEELEVSSTPCYILSYDESESRPAYRPVVAKARRSTNEFYRIHTAAGHVVEATGNHPLYVRGRWCEAASIRVGDVLLRALPEAAHRHGCGNGEEGSQGKHEILLQSELCDTRQQRSEGDGCAQSVHDMRHSDACGEQESYMLGRVSEDGKCKARSEQENGSDKELRHLRSGIQATEQHGEVSVLFDDVQEQGAFGRNGEQSQSELASWHQSESLSEWQRATVSSCQEHCSGLGRKCVCCVQEHVSATGSPRGHGLDEQRRVESGDSVQYMPLRAAWGGSGETEEDVVCLVERVHENTYVYDIQVAGTHNFFADGILVHNCIIDDPVKSREDADSERAREKTWDWYVNDCLTRLKPNASIVLVQTRWHEDDLGGRILERESDKWKVLKLPMEAEADDPLGREPGERLWKDWYTDEMLELAKQDTRSWWALYQQSPTSDEGGYFKSEWMHDYDSPPTGLRIYGASDYAVTEGGGDYTEHGVCGVDSTGNIYILDWWRGQKSADYWIDKKCELINKWSPSCWFGEAGPIRRSIEPFLQKRMMERGAYARIEWLPSIADKEARARGIQALMSMGRLWWPKFAPWKSDVQGQMLRFPAGKHDDAVDVLSLIGRGLKQVNAAKRVGVKRVFQPIQSWMGG